MSNKTIPARLTIDLHYNSENYMDLAAQDLILEHALPHIMEQNLFVCRPPVSQGDLSGMRIESYTASFESNPKDMNLVFLKRFRRGLFVLRNATYHREFAHGCSFFLNNSEAEEGYFQMLSCLAGLSSFSNPIKLSQQLQELLHLLVREATLGAECPDSWDEFEVRLYEILDFLTGWLDRRCEERGITSQVSANLRKQIRSNSEEEFQEKLRRERPKD